jgi:hypothetical protein
MRGSVATTAVGRGLLAAPPGSGVPGAPRAPRAPDLRSPGRGLPGGGSPCACPVDLPRREG